MEELSVVVLYVVVPYLAVIPAHDPTILHQESRRDMRVLGHWDVVRVDNSARMWGTSHRNLPKAEEVMLKPLQRPHKRVEFERN